MVYLIQKWSLISWRWPSSRKVLDFNWWHSHLKNQGSGACKLLSNCQRTCRGGCDLNKVMLWHSDIDHISIYSKVYSLFDDRTVEGKSSGSLHATSWTSQRWPNIYAKDHNRRWELGLTATTLRQKFIHHSRLVKDLHTKKQHDSFEC